ncbi:MAG TPA: ABC transporter ATP-binding protein [Methanospirillum sp.]|uniref:ABC transporter ATP-binding protein n=1 Tax=Methanospirillum sp. TaxID=45200 RepID=UPI002CEDB532|nr:ABC transporter ATP-binding protein [Methanospirillum sp.]HWQ63793.1 ABC transporter ATP-binding protein [Methanospirillum sp.]
MNLIEARDLTKVYHRGSEEVHALKGVTLSVKTGEFLSIVGPSGSGKTGLLNILGLLDNPSGGTVKVHGSDVTHLKEKQRVVVRRDTIGFVFQQFFLIPTMTARENLELPLLFSRKKPDPKKTESILEMLGLAHRGDHLPYQLSGGEMQRVAIGRALMNDPQIILADEPTGNLDSASSEKIYDLFRDLRDKGLTLIVVTHNSELAKRADRVITIRDGILTDEEHQVCCPCA